MTTGLMYALFAAALISSTFVPTSGYSVNVIDGFTVLTSPDADKHVAEMQVLREELRAQLRLVSEVLPQGPLGALRRTQIWVEWEKKNGTAVEFHSSLEWLYANNYNPDKHGGVEINNTGNFIAWSKNAHKTMLLHELAHARFSMLSDYEQLLVHLSYLDAKESGSYESVSYRDGKNRRAYAMTDTQEYFAELTEAYFSTNDYYPFRRSDLKTHDPEGYEAVARAWEVVGNNGSD
jgi:hypothetical protein